MSRLAVVVVGYNRVSGMKRLLSSLECAYYGTDKVDLIISIDNSGLAEPIEAAQQFVWTHGEKLVRSFPQRQGLRKHILSCGEYLQQYDAIAVLEDDIVVSPAYYEYMKQTVEYYKDNSDIAGISLYTHKTNVNVNAPFDAQSGTYDVYYQQFAQSWGQIWMKNQWADFVKWYESHSCDSVAADNVPQYVSNWPETSWLKYHIKYCIDNNKYFVYPYNSLSTCFCDVGEHCKEANTAYQVPMLVQVGKCYALSDDIDKLVVYDAFFERVGLEKRLEFETDELCVDIYGHRTNTQGKRYLLTTKAMPFELVKGYSLEMRPHELNIIMGVEGDDVFLYDTTKQCPKKQNDISAYKHIMYYYKLSVSWKKIKGYCLERAKKKVSEKIKR